MPFRAEKMAMELFTALLLTLVIIINVIVIIILQEFCVKS